MRATERFRLWDRFHVLRVFADSRRLPSAGGIVMAIRAYGRGNQRDGPDRDCDALVQGNTRPRPQARGLQAVGTSGACRDVSSPAAPTRSTAAPQLRAECLGLHHFLPLTSVAATADRTRVGRSLSRRSGPPSRPPQRSRSGLRPSASHAFILFGVRAAPSGHARAAAGEEPGAERRQQVAHDQRVEERAAGEDYGRSSGLCTRSEHAEACGKHPETPTQAMAVAMMRTHLLPIDRRLPPRLT